MNPQAHAFVPRHAVDRRDSIDHQDYARRSPRGELSASPQQHQQQQRSARKPPPPSYVCKICNISGHWIQDCPQKSGGGGGMGFAGATGARATDAGGEQVGERTEGEVTMANPANNYCFIDNDVYAHKNACRPAGPNGVGGWPGDLVAEVEAAR